ncbi:MAG: hypothetical protein JXQ90_14820 [Cyclobacteriaceae bacterium]
MYGLLMMVACSSFSQNVKIGQPEITFYSNLMYKAGIQNHAITQDARGVLHVANNRGLLEYDGETWKRYETNGGTKVRSVEVGVDGKVYVGAQNEFGYFEPEINGAYVYKTLTHLIPDSLKNFEDVWNIYLQDDDVIFITRDYRFTYRNGNLEIITSKEVGGFSFSHQSKILTDFIGKGLYFVENGSWQEYLSYAHLSFNSISSIVNYSEDFDLVATYENGLWLMNPFESKPWARSLTNELSRHKINAFKRLSDGNFVIGTNTNGVYIVNGDGKLVYHFNKLNGLPSRTILCVYEDLNGGIWLGMNNGILRIDWSLPYTYVNENVGLQGTGYNALAHDGSIYLGTNNGLFIIPDGSEQATSRADQVHNIDGLVYNIQLIQNDVIASGHFGLYAIEGRQAQVISSEQGWWGVIETPMQNVAIAGNYNGLYLIVKENGFWRVKHQYPDFDESSRIMEFDKNGKLWMTHGYKGVFSFEFSSDFEKITQMTFYGKQNGFPSNLLINVFEIDDDLIFAAETGIYKYDQTTDQFVIVQELDSIIGQSHVRYMNQDHFGTIYIITSDYTGQIVKNKWGNMSLKSAIFNPIHDKLNDDLENISILRDQVLFASNEGFIAYGPSQALKAPFKNKTLIRNVLLSSPDSLLFGGNYWSSGVRTNSQPKSTIPSISYANNSLAISFATPYFTPGLTYYRYKLDNFDQHWSTWSETNRKEYTNLREGAYRFDVQSKNSFGQISEISSYEFTIAPPWYRETWAYILYFFGTTGLLASSFLMYRRKHKKERSALIHEQKQQLDVKDQALSELSIRSEKEIAELRNQKLKSEIQFKKKELATSTLHLIDKNDFINQIKSSINDVLKTENDGKKVGRPLKKIIKQIDQNLHQDEDWGQFEVHFDAVHDDFLKTIRTNYKQLTPQDIKLCAYLRMNLSTKEIANLMKISVRGVEIARYRLRKKLNLDSKENLVEFMLSQ